MLSTTHRIIADRVYEALREKLNMEVDYGSLLYGSIAPDIHFPMLLKSHTFSDSFDFIMKSVNELKNSIVPENKREMSGFSFKIGVIIHFLSDYFCEMHNGDDENIINHILYENRLHKRYEKHLKSFPVLTTRHRGMEYIQNAREFIQGKHKEYSAIKPEMDKDILYSLSVSVAVSINIAAACLRNSRAVMALQTA